MEVDTAKYHEKSERVITVTFTDELGAAATPASAWYTLVDGDGAVVDSLNQVDLTAVNGTVSTVNIEIGSHCAVAGDKAEETFVLLVSATIATTAQPSGGTFRYEKGFTFVASRADVPAPV